MDVCTFSKFGHCKNGDACTKRHFQKICDKTGCEGRNCDARHPKRCREFARSHFCQFGSFCSYNHRVVERESHQVDVSEEFARDRRVLQERIERMELQIRKLEAMEKELEELVQEAVSAALEKFVYPILRRVQGLEFWMRYQRGDDPHQELKGRYNSNWCGDCGAQWKHGEDHQGKPCSGAVCTCGLPCDQCWGISPIPMEPQMSWVPQYRPYTWLPESPTSAVTIPQQDVMWLPSGPHCPRRTRARWWLPMPAQKEHQISENIL